MLYYELHCIQIENEENFIFAGPCLICSKQITSTVLKEFRFEDIMDDTFMTNGICEKCYNNNDNTALSEKCEKLIKEINQYLSERN